MLILDDTADQAIERVRVKLADEVGAGDLRAFYKPSSGLEPETPSLHMRCFR
jgi:hypothetical protein